MKMRLVAPYFPAKGSRVLTLAAVAAEFDDYFDIEVQDENVDDIDYSHCDIVGINAYIFQLPRAFEMAKKFKAAGSKVIMGGTGPSCMPELCLEHADAVVFGEVEGLGPKIADDFKEGNLRGTYKLDAPPSLAGMKPARTDLIDKSKYFIGGYPVEFSRGCPFRCSFCYSHEMFMTYRTKPVEDIIRDIERRDSDMISTSDLNVGGSREFLKDVCRALAEIKDIEWFGELTLSSLDDDELLKLLEKSNCHGVYVGLESISERTLKSFKKDHNSPEDYKRIIQKVQDHGMTVGAGYLIGVDGEDKSIFERSVEFFEEVKLNYVTPTFITYLPGTKRWSELKAEGRIISEDLEDYDGIHATVRPDMMSVDELMEGVHWFIKNFFSSRSIDIRQFQKPVFKNKVNYARYHAWAWMTSFAYNFWTVEDKKGRSALNSRYALNKKIHRKFSGVPPQLKALVMERANEDDDPKIFASNWERDKARWEDMSGE